MDCRSPILILFCVSVGSNVAVGPTGFLSVPPLQHNEIQRAQHQELLFSAHARVCFPAQRTRTPSTLEQCHRLTWISLCSRLVHQRPLVDRRTKAEQLSDSQRL